MPESITENEAYENIKNFYDSLKSNEFKESMKDLMKKIEKKDDSDDELSKKR